MFEIHWLKLELWQDEREHARKRRATSSVPFASAWDFTLRLVEDVAPGIGVEFTGGVGTRSW